MATPTYSFAVCAEIFDQLEQGDRVRIANSKWEDDRPDLRASMENLLRRGVRLQVMAPTLRSENIDQSWVDHLSNWQEEYPHFEVKWVSSPVLHNKNIFIERKNGERSAWTGAHNFRRRSLIYNFELLMSVQD
ncbi:phospholipase D-like domain-containing protein [Persicobacter psychrovividus]